jgi:membrane protein implicated in regulation of membrane protease activity
MEPYVYWFVLALVLLGVEMATGTFYILVLSIAVALGGVAALAGFEQTMQMALTGVAAVIGTVILRRMKGARPQAAGSNSLDIGQAVKVVVWNADGTARVQYRGAEWDAELESADTSREAMLYIKAMQGSKLILTQHKPK